MFSSTVISRKTRVTWKVRVMPLWKMRSGLEPGDVDALMQDLSLVGLQHPGQQVEGGGLTRPVRTDQTTDPATGDGEAAAVHGVYAAERLAQAACLQDDAVGSRGHQCTMPLRAQPRSMANPIRPRGMNRATTMMNTP